MFIHLHDFNSSPASFKARLQALVRAEEFSAPQLSHWPAQAIATIERELAGRAPESVTLVGSSLGGHYATWIAERRGVRAVLVNPAVTPHALLGASLGPQANLHHSD